MQIYLHFYCTKAIPKEKTAILSAFFFPFPPFPFPFPFPSSVSIFRPPFRFHLPSRPHSLPQPRLVRMGLASVYINAGCYPASLSSPFPPPFPSRLPIPFPPPRFLLQPRLVRMGGICLYKCGMLSRVPLIAPPPRPSHRPFPRAPFPSRLSVPPPLSHCGRVGLWLPRGGFLLVKIA